MKETLLSVFEYSIGMIHMAFAEVSVVGFLLGLVFFLLGLVILTLAVYIAISGRRTVGRVVGAVMDIRIKEKVRNGETVREKKETLWPVYEYKDLKGVLVKRKGSEGGSGVLKYKTGQKVNLIISTSKNNIDVYDADKKSALVMGGVFLLLGAGIMNWTASFYAMLGLGVLGLVGVFISLLFKVLGSKGNRKRTLKDTSKDGLDSEAIRPIEYFVEKEKQAAAENQE